MSDNTNPIEILSDNPDFIPTTSTNEIYVGADMTMCLTDVLEEKADINHTHSGYASQDDLDLLEDIVSAKADTSHTHTEYAAISHTHSEYATSIALDTLAEEVSGKANETHTHSEYASVSHTHNDYAPSSHSHSEYAETGHDHDEDYASIDHAHSEYATVIALNEVSNAVSNKANVSHSHDDVYYTETEVDTKLANKADSSDLTSHTGNTTIHVTSTDKNNWNIAKTHADTAHAPANAEANQNAFSNVAVGNTTISADTKTDTLTFVAGSNVILTPNVEGDSITISATNTVYTHPISAGNKHIPAGGSSGQILRWSADGTAVWGADNNTTYSNATQTASGLMSDTDKTKLDGIAEGANNYTLPSAGTNLGGVKSGGDVTITSGVITVNDDSHNHAISNIDGLQSALDGKATSGHNHNGVYYTESEVDTLLSGKANSSHTHTIANVYGLQAALDGKAASSHGTHVTYSTTAPVMDGTASVGTASTVARSDHKHPTDTSRAAKTSLDSHTSNKSNPHSVTLAQLGVTATAAELNALDGITATVTELNYVDGVTSSIQTQLDGKAASSHGTHVTYGTTVPKANGTAAVGTDTTVSRSDHIHPLQTTVSGNAGTATKLATARTISLTGDVTGSTSFDGSGNVSITATVADDSHNHTIANIDNLQSTLNGKASSSHTHSADAIVTMANVLFGTNSLGGVEYSYGSGSGKNVLTEISNMPQGLHTAYAISGTAGNPKTNESFRFLIHKTSGTIGWILAWDAQGSLFTNYQSAAGTFKGWKCVYDAAPSALWTGAYYMSSSNGTPQTVKPSKKLSECRNGWVLVWSDYDPSTGAKNNTDIHHDYVFKKNCAGANWSGQCMLCDIPRYMGSNANDVDTERRILKAIYIHDDRIEGSYQGSYDERNDVVLRTVYEF